MEDIQIVSATNDIYAPHLAVMFTSIILNHTSANPLRFNIIGGEDLTPAGKTKLTRTLARFNHKPIFWNVDKDFFSKYPLTGILTMETYFRLDIPDLLKKSIKKVIYLDCDTIVNEDIANLWNVDLSQYYVGAVIDTDLQYRCDDLNIPRNSGYFNAGVLVINLEKWRKHNIAGKVIDFLNNPPCDLTYHDQDALNALLFDKWLKLDKKWNTLSIELDHTDDKPSIIHFVTPNKPWSGNPARILEYYKYKEFADGE